LKPRDIVGFLSDYGLEDEFVGVCHGVMLKIAPKLRIVDIHHNILRQRIRHGAIVLQQSMPYMPECVHLAVVDPGVGTGRKAVAIESNWGEIFVGPDNGLLMPAVLGTGGVKRAFTITDERFLLTPISRTFQGRDVFAPAAAHIANGVDPSEFGDPVDVSKLVCLEMPSAWIHDDHLHAEVLQVDRFGNLQFDLERAQLEEIGLLNGSNLEVRVEGHRVSVPLGASFGDVPAGEFVMIEDSYRYLSLAINNGDAAAKLRANAGSTAIIGGVDTSA
jgi:S-adenosylmethionine hydrolase